jgi:hypothetical protein
MLVDGGASISNGVLQTVYHAANMMVKPASNDTPCCYEHVLCFQDFSMTRGICYIFIYFLLQLSDVFAIIAHNFCYEVSADIPSNVSEEVFVDVSGEFSDEVGFATIE